MAANQTLVAKLYRGVIEDVISGVRDAFLDEGVDEAVLQELKQIWETKLAASKAIEPVQDPAEASMQAKIQQAQAGNVATSQAAQQQLQQAAAQAKQVSAATTSAATTGPPAQPTSVVQATGGAATAVRLVPVQITVPPQPGVPNSIAKTITVQVPAHALQDGAAGARLQNVLSSPSATSALSLPGDLAATVLQQHINNALQVTTVRTQNRPDSSAVTQLDGPNDSSSDEEDEVDEDEEDLDDDDDKDDEEHDDDNEENQEEEPLNSEDDVSDDDPADLFETDNVVVCQYDKITRSRNRWKFHLKDGIMSINGRDYVFQKATGDAEW